MGHCTHLIVVWDLSHYMTIFFENRQKRKEKDGRSRFGHTYQTYLLMDFFLTLGTLALKIGKIFGLRNHHPGCGLCEQIKPSQRALARGFGCLLTRSKIRVMVSILSHILSVLWYFLIKSSQFTW